MSGHVEGIEMSSIPDPNNTQEDIDESFAIEDEELGLHGDEAAEGNTMVDSAGARRRSIAHSFGDVGSITGSERRLAARGFWRRMMINGTLIALWYIFSISITVVSRSIVERKS
jgi:solute carrier family 35, member C2